MYGIVCFGVLRFRVLGQSMMELVCEVCEDVFVFCLIQNLIFVFNSIMKFCILNIIIVCFMIWLVLFCWERVQV